MATAFLSLLSVLVLSGHQLLSLTCSVIYGVAFKSYLLGVMLRLKSIIPNEGKLLFLGVLNMTRLDGAFFLVTENTWHLRSVWSSVLTVAKIAKRSSYEAAVNYRIFGRRQDQDL